MMLFSDNGLMDYLDQPNLNQFLLLDYNIYIYTCKWIFLSLKKYEYCNLNIWIINTRKKNITLFIEENLNIIRIIIENWNHSFEIHRGNDYRFVSIVIIARSGACDISRMWIYNADRINRKEKSSLIKAALFKRKTFDDVNEYRPEPFLCRHSDGRKTNWTGSRKVSFPRRCRNRRSAIRATARILVRRFMPTL